MRLHKSIGSCLFALCIFASQSAAQTEVLSHVNVVDVVSGKISYDRNVVIEGGIIKADLAQGDRSAFGGARLIDFTGGYLVPGLWDVHVHLQGIDRAALSSYLAAGIVGLRDVGDENAALEALRDSIDSGLVAGPRLILSGHSRPASRPGVQVWDAALTSDLPTAPRIESINAETKLDRFMRLVREGVAFTPTPVSLRSERSWREDLRLMAETGLILLAGSDAGNSIASIGFSLVDQLISMVDDAGLTPLQSLQSATINVARWFSIASSSGAVAAGRSADLVVLDRNPLENIANLREVRAVVRAGKIYDRIALDSLVLADRR